MEEEGFLLSANPFDPRIAYQMAMGVLNHELQRKRFAAGEAWRQRALERMEEESRRRQDEQEATRRQRSSNVGEELYLAMMQDPGGYGLSERGIEALRQYQPVRDAELRDYSSFMDLFPSLERREGFGLDSKSGEDEVTRRLKANALWTALQAVTDPGQAESLRQRFNDVFGEELLPEGFRFPVETEDPLEKLFKGEGERLGNLIGSSKEPGTISFTVDRLEKGLTDPEAKRALPFYDASADPEQLEREIRERLNFAFAQLDSARNYQGQALQGDRNLLDEGFGWRPSEYPGFPFESRNLPEPPREYTGNMFGFNLEKLESNLLERAKSRVTTGNADSAAWEILQWYDDERLTNEAIERMAKQLIQERHLDPSAVRSRITSYQQRGDEGR